MKNLIILIFCVIAVPFANAGTGSNDLLSQKEIRALLVNNPDSLLTLLDKAEAQNDSRLPQFKIDMYRGWAYNEKQMNSLVVRYAKKVLASDSIDHYPKEKIIALTMLSHAQFYYGNQSESVKTVLEGIEYARSIGNRPAELSMLTTMAQTAFAMGDTALGYSYIDKVLQFEESASSVEVLANVSSAYGVKIVQLQADGEYDKAYKTGLERLKLVDRIDETGGAPDGFTDQQRAYCYARMASSAQRSGRNKEAREAYGKFLATRYGNTDEGRKYITDYLLETGQWSKVIENTRKLFAFYQKSDTINNDYYSLLNCNAKAQYGLGNYKLGYSLVQRAAAINDSLYYREKRTKAQELASVFELNEKELELQASKAEAQRKSIILMAASGIGLLVVIIFIIVFIQYRITLRRNRIAALQIDELLLQKEQLFAASDVADETNKDGAALVEFRRMEQKIWEEKLFVSSDLNRDSLAEACGMSRTKLLQLIQECAGMTPGEYINKLRVEYSVKLIKEHPEWTIDAIAEEAGYGRRATYYIHFNKVYGMTPAQYRRSKCEGLAE